jgi:hypothetical protein
MASILLIEKGCDFDSISPRCLLDRNLYDQGCHRHNVGRFHQVLRYDIEKTDCHNIASRQGG